MKVLLNTLFASEEVMGITYPDDYALLPEGFGEMGHYTSTARFVLSRVGRGGDLRLFG